MHSNHNLYDLPYILLTTTQPNPILEVVIQKLSSDNLYIEPIPQSQEVKLPLELKTTSTYICNLKTKYYTAQFIIYTSSLNECKASATTSYSDHLQGWIHVASESEELSDNFLMLHDALSEAEIKALLLPHPWNESSSNIEKWSSEQFMETIYIDYTEDSIHYNSTETLDPPPTNNVLRNHEKEVNLEDNSKVSETEKDEFRELESFKGKGTLLGNERQGFDRVVEVLECHIWPGHVLINNLEIYKSNVKAETKDEGQIEKENINIEQNLTSDDSEIIEKTSEEPKDGNQFDASDIENFESLIEHFKQVRANSKNLNDEERRKAAADAILLLLPYLDEKE